MFAGKSKSDYIKDESGRVALYDSPDRKKLPGGIRLSVRNRFLKEIQDRQGFINGAYPGSGLKVAGRITAVYPMKGFTVSGAFLYEKDAGETNLFDLASGHIQVNNWKFVRTVVAGDYSANFGQGLTLSTIPSFQKSAAATDIVRRTGNYIKGNTSFSETGFLRGFAANLFHKNLDMFVFFSDRFIDASVDTSTGFARTIYYDGLHRTRTELGRHNSVRELLYGTGLSADLGFLTAGLTYWQSEYSRTFVKDSIPELFGLKGNRAGVFGLNFNLFLKDAVFFGELAVSHENTVAGLCGAKFQVNKIADFVFFYRNYPSGFSNIHSSSFSENGNTENESGFYSAVSIYPADNVHITAYYDIYEFPYRTFNVPLPQKGKGFIVNIDYNASGRLFLNFKFGSKSGEQPVKTTGTSGLESSIVSDMGRTNIRTGFQYSISRLLKVKSRFEYVIVKKDINSFVSKGYALYSDIIAKFPGKASLSARFAVFNTDGYESRIYEFEDDLGGIASNVQLYGRGSRFYIVGYCNLPGSLRFSMKYSATYFDNIQEIGSGNDLIKGKVNSKVSFGIDLNF